MTGLLAAALPLQGQDAEGVRLRTSLEPGRIGVGGTAVLEIEVEVDGGDTPRLRLPSIPDGLQNRGTSQSSQLDVRFPGGIIKRVRHTVRLAGLRAGEYRLSPVVVTVGGQSHRGEPHYLTVEATRAGGTGVLPPPPAGDDDLLLQASLARDTVFVGEPVALTAEAWLGPEARRQLRRAPQYIAPSPPSFWIHDLGELAGTRYALLGRRRYEIQTFRRAFVPITPGDFVLAPAELEVELRRGLLDPFEPRTLATDSLRLTVLPLPDSARPESFRGAVGEYEVSARVSPSRVARGDAVTLEVEVDGRGYTKALPPPPLPPLEGVETFPPSEHAEVRETGGELGGRKVFRWVLIPEREGTLRIPSIEYAVFAPDSAAYKVARTAPLSVEVEPGALAAHLDDGGLRPLRQRPGAPGPEWVDAPWFAAAQLLPLLALIGALLVRLRRARMDRLPRAAIRRRRRALIRALHQMGEESGGDRQLPGALREWLAWRLASSELASAAPSTVAAVAREAGVPGPVAGSLERIIREGDSARFAPRPRELEASRNLAFRAQEIVAVVDRSARRPLAVAPARVSSPGAPRGFRAGAALLIGGLCIAGVGVLAGAADVPSSAPTADFERGVEAYGKAEPRAAAEAFARYVRARPDDPAGWYDLGNALQEIGKEGAATWAWLQVLGRQPRAADARENLLSVGTPVAVLRDARYTLPLSRREHLLAASVLWMLAGALLSATVLGRGRTWGIGAGVALTLAGWLAFQGAAMVPGAGTGIVHASGAALRAEPTREGAVLQRLEERAPLRIVERRGEWRRVAPLGGEDGEGWIHAGDVAPLGRRAVPAAPNPLAAPLGSR